MRPSLGLVEELGAGDRLDKAAAVGVAADEHWYVAEHRFQRLRIRPRIAQMVRATSGTNNDQTSGERHD